MSRTQAGNLRLLWLLPLFAPVALWVQRTHVKNIPINADSGGWPSDAVGERASLAGLSSVLRKNQITQTVSVRYSVTLKSGPRKGASLYYIEYDRSNLTLTKRAYLAPAFGKLPPLRVLSAWRNVSETAIDDIAAPVLKAKTIRELEATQTGHLKELRSYGAILIPREHRGSGP